jgi:lambda family phage portal protein
MKMSDFSDYEDAQLVKQKVAACMAAFITGSENPNIAEDRIERLEPGMIDYLGTGESVEFANPPVVGDYDTYTKKILQGIAASYGITYEMLTMDYSNVNFSSGRMAKIDITNNFRSWQYNLMATQFCAPVWEWFINSCLIVGLLDKKVQSDWTAPRVQQLDPVKETNARLLSVQAGFTTISEIIREDGRDPDEFFDEYHSDMERLKSLGINLKSIIPVPEVSAGGNLNNNNNEQED